MSARVASLIARVAWSLATAAAAGVIAIRLVRNDPVPINTFGMGPAAMMAFLVFGLAWATVGALLVSRRPDNATGRSVLLIGSAYVWSILFTSIAFAGLADGSSAGRWVAGVAGWLTGLAVLIGGAAFNVSIFFPTGRGHTPAWDAVGRLMFVLSLPPIAVGIAVLRYRLYEIDRIISRTIGWTLVTGLLVAVFAGLIVGLQALFSTFTGGNTLAVAASTLVVAALFQPLRQRIQGTVDRRFNRARYDAQRTAETFAEQLRNEVDLARLRVALLATAEDAVRPVSATVWLRAGTRVAR